MSKVIISTFGAGVTSVRTAEGTFTEAKTREVYFGDNKTNIALATASTNVRTKNYGKEIV